MTAFLGLVDLGSIMHKCWKNQVVYYIYLPDVYCSTKLFALSRSTTPFTCKASTDCESPISFDPPSRNCCMVSVCTLSPCRLLVRWISWSEELTSWICPGHGTVTRTD